jgi:hypothetical protein
LFRFHQQEMYWSVVGVNPSGTDDKDLYLYDNIEGNGSPLAGSTYSSGTDFVVADFNHVSPETYYPRVSFGSIFAPYVIDWEGGGEELAPGGELYGSVGGASGTCDLVQCWDVYMEAGSTYRFTLSNPVGDVHACLFRNPGSGACFKGRFYSEFEMTGGTPVSYTAPATDWYGLVVFNNAPGSANGDYILRLKRDPIPLADGQCQTGTYVPQLYRWEQTNIFWASIGVNPSGSDHKFIQVFDNPDGTGSPIVDSGVVSGTNFVIGDFNHTPTGTYYPLPYYGNTAAPFVIEGEGGQETIPFGADVTGTVGGGSGSCGLLKTWDLYLTAGKNYRFSLSQSGSADLRLSMFRNPGSGTYWAARNWSVFEKTAAQTPFTYTAPTSDWYGLVLFNNSPDSPSASYLLRVQDPPTTLTSGVCQTWSSSPRMFGFTQATNYWCGAAVNPVVGDDKDIRIYDNPDGTGTALASSLSGLGTDFVVGDFNHNTQGTYYPRIDYGDTSASYVVEWEDGQDVLHVGVPATGAVGGGSGDCGLIRVYDFFLVAGHTFRFTLTKTGSADIRVAGFSNPSSSPYWMGKFGAAFDQPAGAPYLYVAPASDYMGVVVYNNSPGSFAGQYSLLIEEIIGPDLIVTDLDYQPWPITVNDVVYGRALIRNQGSAPAAASTAGFYRDGMFWCEAATPALAAGQETWTDWYMIGRMLSAGDHTFRVCADYLSQVTELVEENNCMEETFQVVGNSAVDESGSAPPTLRVPNPYTVGAEILLSGGAHSGAIPVAIYDAQGRLTRSLSLAGGGSSARAVRWDGRTDTGAAAGTGVYFIEAAIGGGKLRARFVLIR